MRFLILTILISCFSTVHAQQEWVEYIVGRPNTFFLEAKKATAKEWGIRYKTELAGCIDCEHTQLRTKELNQDNQVYFKHLELRFGQDWLTAFNKAVTKKYSFLWAQKHPKEGIWYEFLPEEKDAAYTTTKKEVAAEWGIPYKMVVVDPSKPLLSKEKEKLRQEVLKNTPYLEMLQNNLGEQWSKWIEEESQWRFLQKNTPANGTWVDVVWGTPNSAYFDAKKAVAERWGIRYETRFLGTTRQPDLVVQQKEYMRQNAVYFSALNQHFPKNWLTAFLREAQQLYAQKLL